MKKLITVAAATVLAGGMLFAVPLAADANTKKRIHVVGGYGHVIVTDLYWKDGAPHERHKSVYPGHKSPKSWSVDVVDFVGESKCVGWGWWTNPSPDVWLGRAALVDHNMTVRVTQAYC